MEIKAKSLVAEQLLQLRRLALFISPHWHSQCRLMLFLLQAQPQLFRWLQQPRTKNTSSLVLLSGGRALSRRASKIAAASSGAMEAGRPSSCASLAQRQSQSFQQSSLVRDRSELAHWLCGRHSVSLEICRPCWRCDACE